MLRRNRRRRRIEPVPTFWDYFRDSRNDIRVPDVFLTLALSGGLALLLSPIFGSWHWWVFVPLWGASSVLLVRFVSEYLQYSADVARIKSQNRELEQSLVAEREELSLQVEHEKELSKLEGELMAERRMRKMYKKMAIDPKNDKQ